MRIALIGLLALVVPALASAQLPSRYVAGEHYTELSGSVANTGGDQVEVIEFFLYGCPHCHDFEPQLTDWVQELPEGVTFKRVPVTFGPAGPTYARIFYTAKSLGVLDELHSDIFDAIHEDDRPLMKEDDIRAFFVEHGVSGDEFDQTFNGDAVDKKINAATVQMQGHQVTSVPSLGVDGRYWINKRQAGGNQAMLDVADYLVERASED